MGIDKRYLEYVLLSSINNVKGSTITNCNIFYERGYFRRYRYF
jgi:hypothetical protein